MDFSKKRIFIFDLDNTLIDTQGAVDISLRRAYSRLSYEAYDDLASKLPFTEFSEALERTYRSPTKEGKTRHDYDASVFEDYCNDTVPRKNLTLRHDRHALAARLYWEFREARFSSLVALPFAFDLLKQIKYVLKFTSYCITQGKCNLQHTKAMVTHIEDLIDDILVVEDKEKELKDYIGTKEIFPEQALIVGDRKTDILAGKRAEIGTVLISASDERFPADSKPDLQIKNLSELLTIVKASKR